MDNLPKDGSLSQSIQYSVTNNTERNGYISKKYQGDGELNRINIRSTAPKVNVPLHQDIYSRKVIVPREEYQIRDTIQPLIYKQETITEIPNIQLITKNIQVNQDHVQLKHVEKQVEKAYTRPNFQPIWDHNFVPRIVPKLEGTPKEIKIDVPQISFEDHVVDKEMIFAQKTVYKHIPQVINESYPVRQVEWKKEYKETPVYKITPKLDVELKIPNPILLPYHTTVETNEVIGNVGNDSVFKKVEPGKL